jgi:hypothetical protein
MFTGVLGVALLVIGAFCPAYGGIFGISVNYLELYLPSDWSNRPLEGRVVEKEGQRMKIVRTTEAEQLVALSLLALAAAVGLLSSVARQYPWAGACGLLALMIVAASGIRLAVFLKELRREVGTPDIGFLFGFQWGWGVLIFGALLLFLTAFLPRR